MWLGNIENKKMCWASGYILHMSISKVKSWSVTEKQGRIKSVGKAGKQVHTSLVLLSLL